MDAPADLMACGHPKGCIVSSETDSACGWCYAIEQAEKDLYRKMVLACPEQNMLEHSGKHSDPWERLTSFVNASRQERHTLKAQVERLKEVGRALRQQVDNAPPGFTPNEMDEILGEET